jgi:hypothetical protein
MKLKSPSDDVLERWAVAQINNLLNVMYGDLPLHAAAAKGAASAHTSSHSKGTSHSSPTAKPPDDPYGALVEKFNTGLDNIATTVDLAKGVLDTYEQKPAPATP